MRLLLRLGLLIAVVFAVGSYCGIASAQAVATPSTLEIVSATAYYDVPDSGNSSVTVLVQYHIDYADALPPQSIDQLLAIKLDGPSEALVASQPFPYRRQGFGYGVVGFFLPHPSGLTSSSALRVSLFYFPGYISSSDTQDTAVTWRPAGEFSQGVIDNLRRLETSYEGEVDLLDDADNLTAAGAIYARNSIPYLATLAPDLYTQQLHEIEVQRREIGSAYADELADTGGGARWRTQFNSTAEWLGQPVIMITTIVVVILGLIAAWFIQKISKSQLVTLPVLAISLAGGALLGWVHLGLIGITAFFSLLILAFVLVLKRSG